MEKRKYTPKEAFGCGGTLVIMLLGAVIGAYTSMGLVGGLFSSALVVILLGALSRARTCEICQAPITHTAYSATVGDRSYSTICAKCKDALTAKARREAIKDL